MTIPQTVASTLVVGLSTAAGVIIRKHLELHFDTFIFQDLIPLIPGLLAMSASARMHHHSVDIRSARKNREARFIDLELTQRRFIRVQALFVSYLYVTGGLIAGGIL
jgi:hypothetical protein